MNSDAVVRWLHDKPEELEGEPHLVIADCWTLGLDPGELQALLQDPLGAWRSLIAPQESRAAALGTIVTVWVGEVPALEIEFGPRFP
ncbi:MAG: hypothetical protein ACLGH3_01095 [Actinomycetota bacterium]